MSYTLIIPTHNRSSYLKRNLDYLVDIKFPLKLIIADSSDDEYASRNKIAVNSVINSIDISYFLLQGHEKYQEKMSKAFAMVETATVMISGDDDFIIPEQVEKCSEFLIANKSFSVACGTVAEFKKLKTNKAVNLIWNNYNQTEVLSETSLERVLEFLPKYRPTFYAVHRTESIQKNFEKIFSQEISRSLIERFFCLLDIIEGKVKVLNGLLLVRERGMTLTDESGKRTWSEDINSLMITKENQKFDRYRDAIIETISKSDVVRNNTSKLGELNKAINEDFDNWKNKKNSARSKNSCLEKLFPLPLAWVRKVKAIFISRSYLKKFSKRDYQYIVKVTDYVNRSPDK